MTRFTKGTNHHPIAQPGEVAIGIPLAQTLVVTRCCQISHTTMVASPKSEPTDENGEEIRENCVAELRPDGSMVMTNVADRSRSWRVRELIRPKTVVAASRIFTQSPSCLDGWNG